MSKSVMSKQRFINGWLRHFAKDIDKKDMEKYVTDQYIWHVFSFDLCDKASFLAGDDARAAYDAAAKDSCIFCEMFGGNGVSDKMREEYSTAKKIDDHVTELYVISPDYSWTCIKTHENGLCGPYFMKIK